MARKVISEKLKRSIAKKFLEGRDAKDLAKMAGVTPQAVRDWGREFKKANPAAVEKPKAHPEPPPAPEAPKAPEPPAASDSLVETPDVAAALQAEGVKETPAPETPASDAPASTEKPEESSPGLPSIIDAEDLADMDDQAMVEMVGTLVMGGSTRAALFVAGWRYKLELDWQDPKFENMYTLTEKEIRALKPCFKYVGPKIRKLIGSSEWMSIIFASSVVGMGCMDRYKAISSMVKKEVRAQAAARNKPA